MNSSLLLISFEISSIFSVRIFKCPNINSNSLYVLETPFHSLELKFSICPRYSISSELFLSAFRRIVTYLREDKLKRMSNRTEKEKMIRENNNKGEN